MKKNNTVIIFASIIIALGIAFGMIFFGKLSYPIENSSTVRAIERAKPSTVSVINKAFVQQNNIDPFAFFFGGGKAADLEPKLADHALGSGFIIKKDKGSYYIITNNHVISGANEIDVLFDDAKKEDPRVIATLIAADPAKDLALLAIPATSKNINPLSFVDQKSLKLGQDVIAIGSPFSLDLKGTVSKGIISRLPEIKTFRTSTSVLNEEVIQTDTAINPGNSGGPLIDLLGNVVGVNTIKQDGDNIGFAITSKVVQEFIKIYLK